MKRQQMWRSFISLSFLSIEISIVCMMCKNWSFLERRNHSCANSVYVAGKHVFKKPALAASCDLAPRSWMLHARNQSTMRVEWLARGSCAVSLFASLFLTKQRAVLKLLHFLFLYIEDSLTNLLCVTYVQFFTSEILNLYLFFLLFLVFLLIYQLPNS